MDDYHEKETITLQSKDPRSRRALHGFLKECGFASEDDFYFLDRADRPRPWQAISVLSVRVYYRGAEVYETDEDLAERDGQWDELRVEYLLASLPASYIERCATECGALATRFGLQLFHEGAAVSPAGLEAELRSIAGRLTESLDEPGSESLGILIAQKYGR